jgi:hypothetical protein
VVQHELLLALMRLLLRLLLRRWILLGVNLRKNLVCVKPVLQHLPQMRWLMMRLKVQMMV